MQFQTTTLDGAWLIQLQPARDSRGPLALGLAMEAVDVGLDSGWTPGSASKPRRSVSAPLLKIAARARAHFSKKGNPPSRESELWQEYWKVSSPPPVCGLPSSSAGLIASSPSGFSAARWTP